MAIDGRRRRDNILSKNLLTVGGYNLPIDTTRMTEELTFSNIYVILGRLDI